MQYRRCLGSSLIRSHGRGIFAETNEFACGPREVVCMMRGSDLENVLEFDLSVGRVDEY